MNIVIDLTLLAVRRLNECSKNENLKVDVITFGDLELGTHVAPVFLYKCAKFVVWGTYGWGAPIFQSQAPLP